MASSATAAGGAGGGISGGAIAGIVAGGAAAAGLGAAYATGVLGKSGTSGGPSCTSQLNAMQSAVNSLVACNTVQCDQSASQTLLNAVGQMCTCFGGGSVPSGYQSLIQEVISDLQQVGYNTSQYQACFK
jgi:hypothetical protein